VPNLELEIRLRMSGHIPLQPSNYTPRRRFTSKISLVGVYDAAGSVIETHEHAGEFKKR